MVSAITVATSAWSGAPPERSIRPMKVFSRYSRSSGEGIPSIISSSLPSASSLIGKEGETDGDASSASLLVFPLEQVLYRRTRREWKPPYFMNVERKVL